MLLTDFQADPLQMKFLAVSSMVTQILVTVLVCLVAEMVVRLVEFVVHQLLFHFVVEITFSPYSAIMM